MSDIPTDCAPPSGWIVTREGYNKGRSLRRECDGALLANRDPSGGIVVYNTPRLHAQELRAIADWLDCENGAFPAGAAWNTLVTAAWNYATHLGQWEKFRLDTKSGPMFVTISRKDSHPDTFERIMP